MKWPYKGFVGNALWVFAAGVIHVFYYTTQALGAVESWFRRKR
jgi:hypothetical protein